MSKQKEEPELNPTQKKIVAILRKCDRIKKSRNATESGKTNQVTKHNNALRPSYYLPEYCDLIILMAKEGFTVNDFACEISVSVSTVKNWRKQYPEFTEAYELAKQNRLKWWMNVGKRKGIEEDFNANVWKFVMMNEFKMTEKSEVTTENAIVVLPAMDNEKLDQNEVDSALASIEVVEDD